MGLVENTGHWSQSAAPVAAVKVLAAQSCGVVVATGQEFPAGHAKQSDNAALLVKLLYVPSGQAVGVVVSGGQKYPVGQLP